MDLFPVRLSSRFGYIDRSGQLKIDFMFDRAVPFSEGLARVVLSGTNAFIDATGSIIMELPQIDLCSDFHNGLAAARQDSKWGYVNAQGEFAIEPKYQFVDDFSSGFAKVSPSSPGTVEFIDRQGNVTLAGRDFRLSQLREGLINCPHKGKWGFLSLDNDFIILPSYTHALPFSEGLAAVATHDPEEHNFIDRHNNLVIPGPFQGATLQFTEGVCVVWDQRKDKFGYIAKDGSLAIPHRFEYAGNFNEEMAAVKIREKGMYGFIDRSGTLLVDTIFTHAQSFANGLASVIIGDSYDQFLYGYVDKRGEYVWHPSR